MANQKYKFELTAIDKTKAAFNRVKSGLGKIKNTAAATTKILGGATLAFGAVATATTLAAKSSFDYIDAIGKVSLRTGLAVETIQALEQAAIESGASIEETRKGFEKFARSVGDASRGLKTQADIFRDLGVNIRDNQGNVKDLDTILRDTAEGISQLGSESEKATALANLFGRAGIKLSEVFRGGAEGIDEFVEKAQKLGITLDQQAIDNVQAFNDSFSILSAQVRTVKDKVFAEFTPVLNQVVTGFSNMMTATDDAESGVDILAQRISKDLLNAFADFVEGIGHIENALAGAKNFFDFLYTAPLIFGTSAEALVNGVTAIKESFSGMGEETQQTTSYFTELAAKIRNTADLLGEDIVPTITLTGGAMKKAGELTSTLTDQLDPLARFGQEFKDVNKLISQGTVDAIKGMEDALVNFVTTGKMSFKDLVDSIIADLVRIQIRKALVGSFDFLSTGLSSLFGKRALGGHVTAGKPYIVGEKGAEMFVPNSSGTIVPNNQMGMSAPSVNFTIQATDASGFDELLVSRKNQIVAMISQAMNQKGKVGLI
jgi:methyl-accepting chemotaxis protein